MNATAQPASAPRRYAVGLGARLPPPTAGARSASQLNAPADIRARPLISDAVTAGADRAASGAAAKRCVLASIASTDMMGSLVPECASVCAADVRSATDRTDPR